MNPPVTREIRQRERRPNWGAGLVWFAVAGFLLLKTSGLQTILVSCAFALVVTGGYAYFLLDKRKSTLFLEAGSVRYQNAFGRERSVAKPGESTTLVRVGATDDGHGWTWLLWVDSDSRTVLRLPEVAWPSESVLELASCASVPVIQVAEPMSMRDINGLYPGAFAWVFAHPAKTTALVGVVLLGGCAIYAFLL